MVPFWEGQSGVTLPAALGTEVVDPELVGSVVGAEGDVGDGSIPDAVLSAEVGCSELLIVPPLALCAFTIPRGSCWYLVADFLEIFDPTAPPTTAPTMMIVSTSAAVEMNIGFRRFNILDGLLSAHPSVVLSVALISGPSKTGTSNPS